MMGHLQKMTNKQRSDFLSDSYEARKAARRGNSFSYLNDEQLKSLFDKGYDYYVFSDGKRETYFKECAKEEVAILRDGKKNFARIVVNPSHNIRGAQTYSILWKARK